MSWTAHPADATTSTNESMTNPDNHARRGSTEAHLEHFFLLHCNHHHRYGQTSPTHELKHQLEYIYIYIVLFTSLSDAFLANNEDGNRQSDTDGEANKMGLAAP